MNNKSIWVYHLKCQNLISFYTYDRCVEIFNFDKRSYSHKISNYNIIRAFTMILINCQKAIYNNPHHKKHATFMVLLVNFLQMSNYKLSSIVVYCSSQVIRNNNYLFYYQIRSPSLSLSLFFFHRFFLFPFSLFSLLFLLSFHLYGFGSGCWFWVWVSWILVVVWV